MRREPGGTEEVLLQPKYAGSSHFFWSTLLILLFTLLEHAQIIFWGSSGVKGIIVYPYACNQKIQCIFLYLLQPLSRGVTLVILIQLCTLYRPPQTLLTHLITFLESHYSVIFILNPIPARNYIKKLLPSL